MLFSFFLFCFSDRYRSDVFSPGRWNVRFGARGEVRGAAFVSMVYWFLFSLLVSYCCFLSGRISCGCKRFGGSRRYPIHGRSPGLKCLLPSQGKKARKKKRKKGCLSSKSRRTSTLHPPPSPPPQPNPDVFLRASTRPRQAHLGYLYRSP